MVKTNMASAKGAVAGACAAVRSGHVSWPIWTAVLWLGLEGFGNLLAIPGQPNQAAWLAAKVLFVVGLLRGWRWVFVLFLIVAALHVAAFRAIAPFVAFLNLVLALLVGSTVNHFFPGSRPPPGSMPASLHDHELDAWPSGDGSGRPGALPGSPGVEGT